MLGCRQQTLLQVDAKKYWIWCVHTRSLSLSVRSGSLSDTECVYGEHMGHTKPSARCNFQHSLYIYIENKWDYFSILPHLTMFTGELVFARCFLTQLLFLLRLVHMQMHEHKKETCAICAQMCCMHNTKICSSSTPTFRSLYTIIFILIFGE